MAKVEWCNAVQLMMGNLVRIDTHGGGYGSGFIIPPPTNTPGNCCVLTAYHVLTLAYETGATITIRSAKTDVRVDLPSLLRYVFVVKDRDQAIICFNAPKDFALLHTIHFLSHDYHYNPGAELGWLGFPCLKKAREVPCFFSGRISAYLPDDEAYLIDGVSIHGLSGGPAFYCDDDGKVVLAGIVTNYYPNEVNNQSWPGLAMFRTINPLMELYEAQDKNAIPQIPDVPVSKKNPSNLHYK
ncbi:MAG: trypsin-like peptidase domain-containing protein [Victivallales bacterium]|nr:trypsin-like peptidase domain-containing protein [Victivallales bacterium]